MTRASILLLLFLAVASGTAASSGGQNSLAGLWKHPLGFVIEFRQAGSEIVGVIVELPATAQAQGYRIGDTVIRGVRIEGNSIQFEATVRPPAAARGSTCAPAMKLFTGLIKPDIAVVDVTAPNFAFDNDSGQTACRFTPLPGTRNVIYTRVDAAPLALRAVRATKNGFQPIDEVVHGRPFFLEAEYAKPDPTAGTRVVLVILSATREPERIVLKHVSGALYRSAEITLFPAAQRSQR
jgi:hypothetical protein